MEKRGALGRSGVSLVSLGQWLGNLCSKSSMIIFQAGTSWDLSFPCVSVFVHVFLVVRSQACMFQVAWPIALPHSHPFLDPGERLNLSMGVFDVFAWGRLNRWDLHWLFYHYEDWSHNDVFKTFGSEHMFFSFQSHYQLVWLGTGLVGSDTL